MNLRFLSLADQEVDEAVAWYDQQTESGGRDFLDELDRVVRLRRQWAVGRMRRTRASMVSQFSEF